MIDDNLNVEPFEDYVINELESQKQMLASILNNMNRITAFQSTILSFLESAKIVKSKEFEKKVAQNYKKLMNKSLDAYMKLHPEDIEQVIDMYSRQYEGSVGNVEPGEA
tara:strand:- start:104 stop:430 length:327 start_codon:yes stop_codon:yes gene_type:complete